MTKGGRLAALARRAAPKNEIRRRNIPKRIARYRRRLSRNFARNGRRRGLLIRSARNIRKRRIRPAGPIRDVLPRLGNRADAPRHAPNRPHTHARVIAQTLIRP